LAGAVREIVCLTREQVRELPSASIRMIGMPKYTHKRDVFRKVRERERERVALLVAEREG
jgi:hypothetical protein